MPSAALSSPPYPSLDPLPASFSLPIAFPSTSSIFTPYEETLSALRLFSAEILLALLFLHSRGIVHQDVKPANVLVSAGGHAVLTDFGSARFLPVEMDNSCARPSHDNMLGLHIDPHPTHCSPHGARPHRYGYGQIVLGPDDQVSFTRRYAAPELLGVHAHPGPAGHGHGHDDGVLVYDHRVDYYSFGVMLRELALGEETDCVDAKRQDVWERASDGRKAREDGVVLDPHFEQFMNQVWSTPGSSPICSDNNA
ncbi:kinase-like domain-containing protein [Trametes elegans]|nr:kinase-like domain-containing protein [Trametes elegans]